MSIESDLSLAVHACSAGQGEKAEGLCRKIMAAAPDHPCALNLLAVLRCQSGRLDEGITLALQILASSPDDIQALETLGDARHAQGKFTDAAEAFRRAVAVQPARGYLHAKLATSLYHANRPDEAVKAYRRAVACGGASADLFVDMGLVLTSLDKAEEAINALHRAVAIAPRHERAWFLLGQQLGRLGRPEEAISAYRKAVDSAPDDADAPYNLALLLNGQGRREDALDALNRALAIRPDFVQALSTASGLLWDMGSFEEAAAAANRAVALKPDHANALTNLGNALKDLGQLDAALAAHHRALVIAPDLIEAHVNLGITLQALGRDDEALAAFERGVALDPGRPWPQFNLALARLRMGDFARGWEGYGWRWETRGLNWDRSELRGPLWTGPGLPDGRFVVTGEQGIGDEIMFAGQVPAPLEAGLDFVLTCDTRLIPLFSRSFPGVPLLSRRDVAAIPADVTAQIPCGDLPRLLRPDLAGAPWSPPAYLRADSRQRDRLRRGYGPLPLAGLAWSTSNRRSGARRSIGLDMLRPLFEVAGLRWVSLQYGEAAARARTAERRLIVDDAVDQMVDMDMFAAQVDAMDFVVTIDNSTAHLAGALGKETWVLLPFDNDWRWLRERKDTPWYPSVRLMRQPSPGDWKSVIDRTATELRQRLGKMPAGPRWRQRP